MTPQDQKFLGELMFFIFIMALMLLLFARSCEKQTAVLRRDTAVKCFEQTQDKDCWRLK
jgi:hypothetical protein